MWNLVNVNLNIQDKSMIERAIKGTAYLTYKPPTTSTFDIDPVLEYININPIGDHNSLKIVTHKFLFLLLIISPQRAAEIAKLNITSMSTTPTEFQYILPIKVKNSTRKHPHHKVTIRNTSIIPNFVLFGRVNTAYQIQKLENNQQTIHYSK
uniref:Uncharacterized protein n=1 Tax=Strongyloides venezuelensis TaxID=75913 RepID=A0A0K0EY15_STRVS